MTEAQIAAVAQVLARWNPLGEAAKSIADLDGYRVEATDIIFGLKMRGNAAKPERFVMDVLNQAFDLNLTPQSCTAAAREIVAILREKVG
ncbi:hypothetical protein [uncultured Thiodictyon sp.]|uniref:hypothetical protein n=1 Tax=uncultured Thiodictyon sp. TaxID=1846217 RepID=UPI0025FBE411|nr:hypothetical protein [uncultured Thiodictyon sp.]